jgi:hypothetical protein
MSRQLELSFRNNTCKSKEKAIKRKCKTIHTWWAKWFLLYLLVIVVNNKIFIHPNTSIIIVVYMKFSLVMTKKRAYYFARREGYSFDRR